MKIDSEQKDESYSEVLDEKEVRWWGKGVFYRLIRINYFKRLKFIKTKSMKLNNKKQRLKVLIRWDECLSLTIKRQKNGSSQV